MIQSGEEGFLRGRTERLHPQRPGTYFLGRHLGLSVGLHIPDQVIQIIFAPFLMQPFQIPGAGQDDQTVPGAGYGHIDQFPVVFQPFISTCIGFVRQCRGKQHHILFVPLKCMHGTAGHMCQMLFFQPVLNGLSLIDKWRDDADTLILVCLRVANDLFHFRRRCIFIIRFSILHIHIDQRRIFLFLRTDQQSGIVILLIIEFYDLRAAPVMIAQQHLVADRVARQIGFIDRIFTIVILIRHHILAAQPFVGGLIQQDHGIKLLRISHQHQFFTPDNRGKRDCGITLACLVHDRHIEAGFRRSQPMG